MTIIAYSPLEQGLLTGRYDEHPESLRALPWPRRWTSQHRRERSRPVVEALARIAREHNATPSQVALAWLCQFHPGLVAVIPGASRMEQAVENRQAMDLALPQRELQRLDDISRQGGPA